VQRVGYAPSIRCQPCITRWDGSKSVATGLRFGFVAAPPASVPLIERAIRVTTWNTPALITAIASEWLDDGETRLATPIEMHRSGPSCGLLSRYGSQTGFLEPERGPAPGHRPRIDAYSSLIPATRRESSRTYRKFEVPNHFVTQNDWQQPRRVENPRPRIGRSPVRSRPWPPGLLRFNGHFFCSVIEPAHLRIRLGDGPIWGRNQRRRWRVVSGGLT
jgi:hypothetical protein